MEDGRSTDECGRDDAPTRRRPWPPGRPTRRGRHVVSAAVSPSATPTPPALARDNRGPMPTATHAARGCGTSATFLPCPRLHGTRRTPAIVRSAQRSGTSVLSARSDCHTVAAAASARATSDRPNSPPAKRRPSLVVHKSDREERCDSDRPKRPAGSARRQRTAGRASPQARRADRSAPHIQQPDADLLRGVSRPAVIPSAPAATSP